MRALERHVDLEELELWSRDPGVLSAGDKARREEIGNHMEQCAECSEIAEAHTLISGVSNPAPGGNGCPADDVWLEVAANLVSEDKLKTCLAHASECSRCADELKIAIDAVGNKRIEQEIAGLASSTPEWQADAARLLQGMSSARSPAPVVPMRARRWWSWPAFAYAMAALLITAIAVGGWYVLHPGMDTQVARAADALRLTPLRIPGAHAVALYSPVRGRSSRPEWPQLLDVRAAAQKAIEKDSESPYWRQVLGRTYILQNDPASALAEFQTAHIKDPHLDRIEFDLGTAYFELGEQTGDKSNYGFAAEHFSNFLGPEGRDPATLFNRALSEEHTQAWGLARKDLEDALKYETQPDWKQAVQKELDNLGENGGAKRHSPDDNGAEIYEAALTGVFAAAAAAPDLAEAAREGQRHGDFWLADWLRTVGGSDAGDTVLLAEAVKANRAGNADQALAAAHRAELGYARSGNQPGLARSEVEEIYALQRMGRAQDCLQLIHSPPLQGTLRRYSYLRTMVLLEDAACEEMAGAMQHSKLAIDRARAAAAADRFPTLYARAQGFLAGYYTLKGAPEQGWNANVSGLEYCREHPCPPMREYQFLSDLIDDAVSLGLDKFAVLLARENVEFARRAGNLQNTAYAYEVLGQRQLECGLAADARDSFSQADGLLNQLGDNAATRSYRADWAADRSELLAEQGRGDLALEQLSSASRDISAAESLLMQLNYWSRRALVEHRAGQHEAALRSARKAVDYADQVRHGLANYADRQAWRANSRMAYVTLVESLLQSNQPREALQTWEAYQTATEDGKVAIRESLRGPALIFARLVEVYAVFTLGAGEDSVSVEVVPWSAEAIDQLARTFSILCSDPHSRISEVRYAGQSLYSILLANRGAGTDHAQLRIESSGALRRLPFGALVLPDGTYLGARRDVTQLSEFWTLRPEEKAERFSPSVPILILRTKQAEAGAIPAAYDETADLIKTFSRAQVVDGADEERAAFLRSLAAAQIFHFSGHAVSGQGKTRLLLASDPPLPDSSLSADWLDGVSLPRTRLAVLAACSTAGGDDFAASQGTDLGEAFLRAGTWAVVASLWDVDSEATRLLMVAFYRDLAKGNSPAAALHSAQAVLSENANFRHPYFWSGFRLLE